MADIIRALKDTPIPTLLLLIGVLMLSVGFGVRLKIIFDVDQINKTYAKIMGTVFLVFGLVPYSLSLAPNVLFQPDAATDPFLVYYVVSVPIVIGLYWAALKFTKGEIQIYTAKRCFMFVGCLATVAVLWRAMDIYFYLNASDRPRSMPPGFYERHSYLPYFALLGTGFIASIWIIYANTRKRPNAVNRIPILNYFILSCLYLAFCRLAWEFIDYIPRTQIPG